MAATTEVNNNYKLGYKSHYILTGLGQLPFDIYTELSKTSTLPHNGHIQQDSAIKKTNGQYGFVQAHRAN